MRTLTKTASVQRCTGRFKAQRSDFHRPRHPLAFANALGGSREPRPFAVWVCVCVCVWVLCSRTSPRHAAPAGRRSSAPAARPARPARPAAGPSAAQTARPCGPGSNPIGVRPPPSPRSGPAAPAAEPWPRSVVRRTSDHRPLRHGRRPAGAPLPHPASGWASSPSRLPPLRCVAPHRNAVSWLSTDTSVQCPTALTHPSGEHSAAAGGSKCAGG